MKILITGSTGFVGRNLVKFLEENTEHSLILPVRNFKKAEKYFNLNQKIRAVEFTEDLEPVVLIEKPDIVINLLGILYEDAERNITFEKVHYIFTKQLVDGAKKIKVKRFLQMSALGANINSESRYFKTKAAAESYIKASNIDYIIYRPSIILGKEQRLFKDLKRFSKFAPFLIAPKGKVQPINIKDVVIGFYKGITLEKTNEIFEMCGSKIITYKQLFEFALNYLNIKKPIIELDRKFLLPLVLITSVLKEPPITYQQWLMLKQDNVCSDSKKLLELLESISDPFNI